MREERSFWSWGLLTIGLLREGFRGVFQRMPVGAVKVWMLAAMIFLAWFWMAELMESMN